MQIFQLVYIVYMSIIFCIVIYIMAKFRETLNIIQHRYTTEIKQLESRDYFAEMQESVLSDVSEAINNLKAGRYEETYNILVELSDELTTDLIISKSENEDNYKKRTW